MRRAALLLLLPAAATASIAACALLPERFAVNAPVAHMVLGSWFAAEAPPEEAFGSRIRVEPEGFSIGLFAEEVPGVRMLEPLPGGALLASTPRSGQVWKLEADADGDGRSDRVAPLLEGLDRPHGLAWHEGWLYVAEGDGVGRVRLDGDSGELRGDYARVVEDLPSGGNHWTRTVGIGPDGWMYVSVGSSCNVCFEKDERRAAMLRFRPDGSEGGIYATGLRNAVGFDWQPGSGALYATDNGRDLLGDDFPPCELNHVEAGAFYGWPIANGDRVLDPDLGAGHEERARESRPPAHDFAAHNAPLGMIFLRHWDQPPEWRGVALVALHGSWNRSEKDGYKVVSLHWDSDGTIRERDFVVGFEHEENVIGRPVDVAEGANGAIYISDDYAGSIYRVWQGDAEPGVAVAPESAAAAEARPEGAVPGDGGDAEAGAALYALHECARCHEAERAEAGVVPVALRSLEERYDAARLSAFLAAPTPPMPQVALDERERLDLAAYLLRRFR